MMRIALGSDHGGYALKCKIKEHLESRGYECVDFGCHSLESCDYPDFGEAAARAVAAGDCPRGIVRCAHCADTVEARLTREHNDANMLAIGAGFTGELLALEMVDVFLNTPFSEGERHARRVAKVNAIQP